MTEQQTLRDMTALADKYGPYAAGAFVVILVLGVIAIALVFLYVRSKIKKEAVNPIKDHSEKVNNLVSEVDKLRIIKNDLVERIHGLELQIKDRVTYEWAEGKLIPKIEALGKDIRILGTDIVGIKGTIDAQIEMGRLISSSVRDLADTIKRHDSRLSKMEGANAK